MSKFSSCDLFSFYTVYACVFTSIHREGFNCLEQLECQGADQGCCVEDVPFFCQVFITSHTLEAGKATT